MSHWKSVWQGPECSPIQWQHRRMVQNYSRSPPRVSTLTNPLWHLSYKMEIGPDKTKMMTNNPNGFQREIKIKGQRLEEVDNFKYLGAICSNEGSKPKILSRIAQTTAALSRLKIIWRDKNISLASKVKLCSSYPPSFMHVRTGPWQQKLREGSKPSRWDSKGDFWTFPTKIMWRTRRFATECNWSAWWSSPNHGKETESLMVWPHLKIL